MNTLTMFASISAGGGIIQSLIYLFLVLVCALILWGLGKYAFGVFGAPAIVLTGWTLLFVVVGAIVLINFLLGLAGHPMWSW
jgi:hypothetical protein